MRGFLPVREVCRGAYRYTVARLTPSVVAMGAAPAVMHKTCKRTFSFVNALGVTMDCPTPVVPHRPPSAVDEPTPTRWRPWRRPLPESLLLGVPLGAPIVLWRQFRRRCPVFAPPGQFGWLDRIIVGYLAQDRIYSGLSQMPPVVTPRFG